MLHDLRHVLQHPLGGPRALPRVVRWQVAARLFPSVVVDWVNGTKLVARRGMHGVTGNIYCGLQEFAEMAFLLHFLRPGDLMVDVGANAGTHALLAWSTGAGVIAFEPGEAFDDLRRTMAVNAADADLRRQAVGDRPGELRFTTGLDALNRAALVGEPAISVPMVTLDEAVSEPISLLKIDVEGFETAVIGGARVTLTERPPPAVLVETEGHGARFGYDEQEIVATMRGLGYTPHGYDPFSRTLTPPQGVNVIFVHGDIGERLRSAATVTVLGRTF